MKQRLRRHVDMLADQIGERNSFCYENLEKARKYIARVFADAGYEIRQDAYRVGRRTYRNVWVEQQGQSDRLVLAGAHYDTAIGSPGADDNASGVAVLLEMARLLKGIRLPFRFRFAAFTLEEPPFFRTSNMGSLIHAKRCRRKNETVVGMLSLEMLGYFSRKSGSQGYPLPLMRWFYPDRGNFIAVAGNFRSRKLVRRVSELLQKGCDIGVESTALPFVPGVGLSDNWSFWKEGYPAVMITDTAFFRNPHYHLSSDLPGTLDYDSMTAVANGLSALIQQFGDQSVSTR